MSLIPQVEVNSSLINEREVLIIVPDDFSPEEISNFTGFASTQVVSRRYLPIYLQHIEKPISNNTVTSTTQEDDRNYDDFTDSDDDLPEINFNRIRAAHRAAAISDQENDQDSSDNELDLQNYQIGPQGLEFGP